MNPIADFINRVAEHIDRVGLNQNGDFYGRKPNSEKALKDCPACIIGAMSITWSEDARAGGEIPYYEVLKVVRNGLPGDNIAIYSDNAPSKADVVEKLRIIAASL